MIHGVINVYKEQGYTSHDVVAKLRGILHQKRIGHTGTLDPAAEGVLPVCLGNATRLVERLTDKTKEYLSTMRLGIVTDTDDLTGTVLSEHRGDLPSEAEIESACRSFIGTYAQLPPMYSAIKQDGKKLYEIARARQTVERKTREVTVSELQILTPDDVPETDPASGSVRDVRFRAVVSKGTYIRALCRDIGEKLGCGASMAALVRTRSGEFLAETALKLDRIEALAGTEEFSEAVLPVEHFYEEYPAFTVRAENRKQIDNGNPLKYECFLPGADPAALYARIYDDENRFRALYRYDKERDLWMPETVFPV